jgi:group II intron reverse transcriptase/maturase
MENKGLTRLEKIREINQRKPGWINRDLCRLMYQEDIFMSAYEKTRRNKGALTPGITPETVEAFSIQKIKETIETIKNGTFEFNPARRIYIPKPGKKEKRPLGIPGFSDKLVQEVIRMILEVIYEPTFQDCSHGFRPKRSCHTALKYVEQKFNGVKWIVEGDIKGAYDNIDHKILIGILEERIQDEKFINLIRKALKAGYLESEAGLIKPFIGTPQGSLVSPILANLYLELDLFVLKMKREYEDSNKDKPWNALGKYTQEYNKLRKKNQATDRGNKKVALQ